MKSLIFFFASVILLQSVSAQVAVPKTCEDVLPADTCTKLRDVAKIFHEKVGIVNEAIRAALDKHITNAKEVLNFVKTYLIEKANNFKCEDVLSEDQCNKLTDLASKFQVSVKNLTRDIEEAIVNGVTKGKELYQKTVEILLSKMSNLKCEDLASAETCEKIKVFADNVHASAQEVKKALIEAYAKGVASAQDYYNKVVEFITSDITCEQILNVETCAKLESIAKIFHEKVGIVNEAVQEAVRKHLTKLTEIINFAKTYLVEKATNFKCTDVLSQDQCDNLVKIAGKFKVSVANLTHDIEEAIADGIVKGKALYQKTIEIMLAKIDNLSCEQLIDANTCQKIKDFGAKVHATSQDIQRAIIDAYSKGLVNAKEFLDDAIEYLTNEISCDRVLSAETCTKLQDLADKFGASFDKIMDVLRESVANGITKITDLYKAAVKYIMDKWLGIVSYRAKRSIDFTGISEALKKAIKEHLDKLSSEAKVIEEKIKAAVKEAILKGQLKLAQIKEFIKKLIEELAAEKKTAPMTMVYKRSVQESLKESLEEMRNKIKEGLKESMSKLAELFKKLKEQLEKMQGNSVDEKIKDEFLQDMELMDSLTKMESNKIFAQMDNVVDNKFSDMIADITFDTDVMYDSLASDIQKIDLKSWINDEIIAVIEKVVNKVFGPELRTKIDAWIEKHKSIVVEAVKDGAEALFALIKSHWSDILGIFG